MEFNLKAIRKAKGISQARLAEISGVGRVTISRMETGELKETTSGTLVKLANALGTTVDSLVKQ